MKVLVNGTPSEFEVAKTVQEIVATVTDRPEGRGLAVALNGEVVPRHRWQETSVVEGDRVEVLRAVGGG